MYAHWYIWTVPNKDTEILLIQNCNEFIEKHKKNTWRGHLQKQIHARAKKCEWSVPGKKNHMYMYM
jgi:hypothetical protein